MAGTEFNRPTLCRDCLDPSHPVRQRIEAARRRLEKAQAVITAPGYSLNHDAIDVAEAGDVATVVGDLIRLAVDGLDAVELARTEPAQGSE